MAFICCGTPLDGCYPTPEVLKCRFHRVLGMQAARPNHNPGDGAKVLRDSASTQRKKGTFHCDTSKNQETRRQIEELRIVETTSSHLWLSFLKSLRTRGIVQGISINSEWSQRNDNLISPLTAVILLQSSTWQELYSMKLVIFLPSF